MGLIEWVKNGLAAKKQEVDRTPPRPPHAKQYFAEQSAAIEASYKPVHRLAESVKAASIEAGHPDISQGAASQHQGKAPGGEHDDVKGALMHNQSAAEKAQKPMSPTDGKKGHTRGRGMER